MFTIIYKSRQSLYVGPFAVEVVQLQRCVGLYDELLSEVASVEGNYTSNRITRFLTLHLYYYFQTHLFSTLTTPTSFECSTSNST